MDLEVENCSNPTINFLQLASELNLNSCVSIRVKISREYIEHAATFLPDLRSFHFGALFSMQIQARALLLGMIRRRLL